MEHNAFEANAWNSPKQSHTPALAPSPTNAGVPVSGKQQLGGGVRNLISRETGHARVDKSDEDTLDIIERPNKGDDFEATYSDEDEEAGLDPEGRRQKRRRRNRDTSLDGRVAGDALTAQDERKLADLAVLRRSIVNALLIALWYVFSISISIYNKWMFSPDNLDFRFPLFTTSMHMVVQFVLASATLYFFPQYRPARAVEAEENDKQGQEGTPPESKKPLMTPWFYISRIGPCGTATGLDIGLGNMSLKFISLTFFTMCKSSALAFVLLWAFIFRLETPSLKLILIIITMTGGVIMMVAGETAFNLLGFMLILLSAFFSGFRWALTQILLLRNAATSNPFSSIFFLTPITFLAIFVLAIPIEGFEPLAEGFARLASWKGTLVGILLILFPGAIAFCMMSAEYALLKRTSVVTLSICGIFKEVLTITASEIVYHDPLTPINVSGLIVTIASIAAYNYIKVKKMRADAREILHGVAHQEEAEAGMREETMQMLDAVEAEERRSGEAEEEEGRREETMQMLDAVEEEERRSEEVDGVYRVGEGGEEERLVR